MHDVPVIIFAKNVWKVRLLLCDRCCRQVGQSTLWLRLRVHKKTGAGSTTAIY